MDLVTSIGIILSISSITLSLIAIWFAWVSYKNTTDMQMKAQAILEQVSQKVEVVVNLTSQQVEKAWNYFTQNPISTVDKKEEVSFNINELRKQIIDENKIETEKLIKEAGIGKTEFELLTSKFEELFGKTTEKTEEIYNKQLIMNKYFEIESELKKWFERKIKWIFPPIITMPQMMHNEEIINVLPKSMIKDINTFIDIRNRIAHSQSVDEKEVEFALKIATEYLFFLRNN
jgi:hypothetical protein